MYIYRRGESKQDYSYWTFRCIKQYQQSFLDIVCFQVYNAPLNICEHLVVLLAWKSKKIIQKLFL